MTKQRPEVLVAVGLFALFALFAPSSCGQSQLEAAEGANITLQWDSGLSLAPSHLILNCFQLDSGHRPSRVVLEVAEGEQRPHSASGQFFGRVLWDRGVLGLGQVRILLTRVSAEDHGQFWCYIYANYHHPTSRWSHIRSEFFNLTVTRTKPTETRSGGATQFFNLTVTRTKPTETRSGGATRVSELAPLRTAFLCFMFSCMVLMAVAIVSASLCGRCT